MGRRYDEGFLEAGIDIDIALLVHCTSNCYPPIDTRFIPYFKRAIYEVSYGDYSIKIMLPNGKALSAGDIIHQAHLEAFVGQGDDEEL
jgi:hypothetical protein